MMVGWMGTGLPLMAGFVAEVAVLIAFYMAFGWWVLLAALIVTAPLLRRCTNHLRRVAMTTTIDFNYLNTSWRIST